MKMNRDEVWNILKKAILEIFPEYASREIGFDASLKALGANSVDRAEILMVTMESLGTKVPMVEFSGAANIGELVAILHLHCMKEQIPVEQQGKTIQS